MGAEKEEHSCYLEWLFEHRNKEYGAYALQKGYNGALLKGSVGMCLMVVLCMGGYYWWGGREKVVRGPLKLGVPFCPIQTVTKETPAERVPLQTKIKPPLPLHVVPYIVQDTSVETQDLEDITIASAIREGIADNLFLQDLALPEKFGTDAASSRDSVEHDRICIPFEEELPQYPGGHEAMLRFIVNELGPPYALAILEDSVKEKLEKVIVLSQFRIDVDGQLTDIRFPRPAIEPYQTEVRRILEAMPKWIPGTRNKKPVRMYQALPINILLVEE